ncbi:hypothetical protein BDV97DRAFT_311532 [Delphinella strobiligena]|nr:hypothetical protein BDV97DRAFT_311532 [Delphinella strobiligena]
MDSPYFNPSSSTHSRSRADSSFSITSTTDTNSVRKRSISQSSRPRSISTANIERYGKLLPEQIQNHLNLYSAPLNSSDWPISQPSPQPNTLPPPRIQEIAPTPVERQHNPNLPNQNTDRRNEPITAITSAEHTVKSEPSTTSGNMASLEYLPPPQYGHMAFQDPSFNSHYQNLSFQSQSTQSGNLHSLFHQDSFSSQPIYASGPLSMEPSFSTSSIEPSLTHITDPMSNLNRGTSPFQQPVYDSLEYSGQHLPSSRSISHSPMSSHQLPMGSISPPLNNAIERSPHFFEPSIYSGSFSSPAVQPPHQLYQGSQSFSYPPPQQLSSSTCQSVPRLGSDSHVRVLNQKPKPQCWEHGCNGREFSTFSNLLRHQREKSGTAAKSYCPKCGAEFTRTTARNGHLAHEKCSKQRRTSTDEK